jgi:isoleucyl-tRNA synthetase
MARFPHPQALATGLPAGRSGKWQELLVVRDAVLKELEEKRNAKEINASLEARIVLYAGGALYTLLQEYEGELPALFIVSQVEVAPGSKGGGDGAGDGAGSAAGLKVEVQRARGAKCERCWNYSTRVGESGRWPTVCERCVAALEEITRTTT